MVNSLSGARVPPARNFLEPFRAGLFKKSNPVSGVLEFMDVGPYLGLPAVVVDSGLAAGGAAGMQAQHQARHGIFRLQFYKDAAHFLDVLVLAYQVLVTQEVTEAELVGF